LDHRLCKFFIGTTIHLIHLAKIGDGDRVYPGDGVAPISDIVKGFLQVGATPVLSLELFNKKYWAMPPLEAARIGIEKMKASVAPAL
jgi:sugar phosphate isomerase/epimerase